MTSVRRSTTVWMFAVACAVCTATGGIPIVHAAAASGIATHDDPRQLDVLTPQDRMTPFEPGPATTLGRAAAAFVAQHGGQWSFRTDPRTARIAFAQGSGIPITAFAGPGRSKIASPEALADAVRAFVETHRALLGPSVGELVWNEDATLRGRLATVRFDWQLDGTPVEGAAVFVRLNSNRITQFGSRFIAGVEIFPEPAVNAEQARRALLQYSGDGEDARFVTEPSLLVTPLDRSGGAGLDYRMVWRMSYRVPGREETWEGRIDAGTGAVIGFRDSNVYGQARGGVYPRTVWQRNETPAPLPNLSLTIDGKTVFADAAGRFDYGGGDVHADLSGRHLTTNCVDCSHPAQPASVESIGAGIVDFGLQGLDEVGNGKSTAADRNVYYHTQQVRRIAKKWLPTMRWLRRARLTSNVNIPLSCNAFYSDEERSINFFRTGGGCNNTGLIADVVYHEWGHAIDFATLVLDGSTGEGTADVVSMHMTRHPLVAPGFRSDGRPIRDLDATTNALGFMTLDRVDAGACSLPGGGVSIHCIGTVYGQTAWDLAQALVARYGEYTGWRISERLFYQSLPDAGSLLPDSPFSIYAAYLQADDDDGNLANGTPNAVAIHTAFAAHGIAQAPVGTSLSIEPPRRPAVEATARCDGVELRWAPSGGAARYDVLRTELDATGPLFPVASVPANGSEPLVLTDEVVAPGFAYRYAVIAVAANGRESSVDPGPPVVVPHRPLLSVRSVDVTDSPLGNRSGFWDPGETLAIVPTLANLGNTPAVGVRGRLEAVTPGVALLEDRVAWADLAPGDSAPAETPLVVRIDEAVACGEVLEFRLVPEETGGCTEVDPSWFSLTLGAPSAGAGFVCDETPVCLDEPAFGGLERVEPAGCGELQLRWFAAESNCSNAVMRYDVFRSAEPDFEPNASNRIAAGIRATHWLDHLLEPGQAYSYAVRAVDSRSGSDANSRKVSAIAPAGLDLAPPVFSSTVTAASGELCGETRLDWDGALETCSLPVTYNVYRSTAPDFLPDPTTLVGATTDTEFTDTGVPGTVYHYVVLAADDVGNATAALAGDSARAYVFDRKLTCTGFDTNDAGWSPIEPNDAERGNWEWGDPEGDDFQPEDDASTDGTYCWMTGIARMTEEGNNNDVDFGTTTLASARYDIAGTVDPVVRYSRWFTNDRATNPGDPRDTLRVHVSDDDGISWTLLEEVGAGTPLSWVPVEFSLAGIVDATDRLRLRFTAADIGGSIEDASKVEAGIDEFSIYDRGQGCADCADTPQAVRHVALGRDGDNVVLEWTAVENSRYSIATLDATGNATPIGTARTNRFVHLGAARSRRSFVYRVTAGPLCGD